MADDLKQILTGKLKHKNFSEEVDIISESVAGVNMSTYVVKNKNSVTFQLVPGMPYQRNRGKMGFVNGDKSRPMLIGSSGPKFTSAYGPRFANTRQWLDVNNAAPNTIENDSTVSDPGLPSADLTPSVKWDIKLEISSGPGCTGSTTQTEAVEAL